MLNWRSSGREARQISAFGPHVALTLVPVTLDCLAGMLLILKIQPVCQFLSLPAKSRDVLFRPN